MDRHPCPALAIFYTTCSVLSAKTMVIFPLVALHRSHPCDFSGNFAAPHQPSLGVPSIDLQRLVYAQYYHCKSDLVNRNDPTRSQSPLMGLFADV